MKTMKWQTINTQRYLRDTDTLICQYDADEYKKQKALLEEKYVFQAEEEIVYMAFYDDDLDVIYSLKDFIHNDCGWKYIR